MSYVSPLTVASVAQHILVIRGQKVMLNKDLAKLYGVTTKRLNEQVRRNKKRFPERFMFQLTPMEFLILKSQFAASSWGGVRTPPYVFTEHGALMLASVLNSPRAIQASILVIDAFVRLRELLATNKELAAKLFELEQKLSSHDKALMDIIHSIRQLTTEPEIQKNPIGFTNRLKKTK